MPPDYPQLRPFAFPLVHLGQVFCFGDLLFVGADDAGKQVIQSERGIYGQLFRLVKTHCHGIGCCGKPVNGIFNGFQRTDGVTEFILVPKMDPALIFNVLSEGNMAQVVNKLPDDGIFGIFAQIGVVKIDQIQIVNAIIRFVAEEVIPHRLRDGSGRYINTLPLIMLKAVQGFRKVLVGADDFRYFHPVLFMQTSHNLHIFQTIRIPAFAEAPPLKNVNRAKGIPFRSIFNPSIDHRMQTNELLKFRAVLMVFFLMSASAFSQSGLPVLEFPASAKHNYMVIFFSGDGGWKELDQSVTAYLNGKNIPVLGINTKKYLWEEKKPQIIARDIESLEQTYCAKWKVSNVVLIGYSMGAEILPHSVNEMKDAWTGKVKDMILIAPDENACFEVKLIFYAYDTNEGEPIIDQLRKLKIKKAYCICDEHPISLCNTGLDGVIDHTLLTGGHHFDGDYGVLCKIIGKRLNLE